MKILKYAILAILLAFADFGNAATFKPRRGINMEVWLTWPGEENWGKPEIILPFPEWRRTVDLNEFQRLRTLGLDFIRLNVDPGVYLSPNAEPLREQLFAHTLQAIDLIHRADLKVILSLQTIPLERSGNVRQILAEPDKFEQYKQLIRDMGKRISHLDPERTAFELFNEPTTGCGSDQAWPDQQLQLFAAARAQATRLTLVLTGACWSGHNGLTSLDPALIPDNNIIWTFHSYDPFIIAMQGAPWAGDLVVHVEALPYPPHAHPEAFARGIEKTLQNIETKAPLLRRVSLQHYFNQQAELIRSKEGLRADMSIPFDEVSKWAQRHRLDPQTILLGEFGMFGRSHPPTPVVPNSWRAAYLSDMIGLAEEAGFAWAIYSHTGAMGVVGDVTGKRFPEDVIRKALEQHTLSGK